MELDKLLPVFIEEARDAMRELDIHLSLLADHPNSQQALDQIAKLLHSVKGASGFLGLARLEAVCASCETLLCAIYDGVVTVDAQVIHILRLARSDVSALINSVDRDGVEADSKFEHIIRRIHAVTGASNH